MNKNCSRQGFAYVLLLLVLVAGLAVGIFLIQKPKIFKSQASGNPIVFILNGLACNPTLQSCTSQSGTIKIELTSTLGKPVSATPTSQLTMQGLQNTFGSVRGNPKYDSNYDVNNDGKVNITDFNILKRNGSLSASASATVNGTVSYKIAETSTELDTATAQPYIQEPTQIDYVIKDTTPGQKFIWVEFKDSTGKTERKSASLEIVVATPTPSPIPTSVPTPAPSPTKTPSPSPTPTVVSLFRSVRGFGTNYLPNASGSLSISINSYDASTDYGKFKITGSVQSLEPNRNYQVWLCWPDGINCSSNASTATFNTNSSGFANFDGLTISAYNRPRNRISYVRITDNPSPNATQYCTLTSDSCLKGYYGVPGY